MRVRVMDPGKSRRRPIAGRTEASGTDRQSDTQPELNERLGAVYVIWDRKSLDNRSLGINALIDGIAHGQSS